MKKISFLLLSLFLFPQITQARPSKSRTLGIMGMGNIQLLNTAPQLDPGPGGGAFFDYRFNQRFSVTIDAWATTHDGDGPSEAEDSIQILGIPTFTIKLYLSDNESARFDPYAGIGIGAYATTEGSVANGTNGVGLGAHIDTGFDYHISEVISAGFSGIFRSTALITNLNSSGNNALALIPYSLVGRVGFHF
ncbi:MAG: outer membrane beta-barrel protein [Deltaproteobacteria bacterium]|nr:outer membrane beta-barrel protein [Deltaproteobacteria bacterium]